ncbi:putative outer membrane starch-binding protein [Arenibacter algicola]|uniref:Outer membrane starch-binding protein n=1 Tax=Arenibacter algicola TaxID=616991 RepID=A0ABY3AI43_9FLAO
MKNKILDKSLFYAWTLLTLLITGCSEEFVEVQPTSSVTSDAVFSSFTNTNIFLNELYSDIPANDEWFSYDPRANWSDDSQATFGWVTSNNGIARRDYSTSNAPVGNGTWASHYASIRKANLLIKGVENAVEGIYNQEEKDELIGQAKFLRAFFYLRLAKYFGGVPLIDKVLDRSSDEDLTYPRSSYEETIDFIVKDCREAADVLPTVWTGDGSTRASKGAALAQMADAQLFSERWGACVTTCEEIFTLGYDLVDNYVSIFRPETEDNQEVIFDVEFNESFAHDSEVFNSPRVDPVTGVAAGWGHLLPTQELVDAYEFKDGTQGDDLGHAADPYVGRDERFYATILYNGSDWRGGKIWTYFDPTVQQGTFSNSFDDNHTHQGTLTGYYFAKHLNPNVVPSETTFYGQSVGTTNAIIYRFGEILLMYAEAKNELSGPDGTVYDAVNRLRTRGGILPLSGLSQAEMRERIRNERRVELAFEGDKRYWDIIRWRIAGQVFNRSKGGMRILEQPDGSLEYNRVDAFRGEMRFVEPRDYLFPIPQAAIEVNPKLEQNPGW